MIKSQVFHWVIEPPAAPEVNIRLTKDGCAFEVRVEIEKKPLLPTLKDRIPVSN
ncbi:hypothetical protein DPMN_083995 [Dreissena polymorpha]|uniref:Uncharacterized protein n=1 Tax=Dreissena polymorpha TaxID=45954 RepID=A0A9D3YAB9_DREPO|nr:hypothetical protein DPMN_083995 [Dreissena polymorpha]